jgi:hypothetical protein
MGICLKELRENYWKIKPNVRFNKSNDCKSEANELISIFVSSIKTAKTNLK